MNFLAQPRLARTSKIKIAYQQSSPSLGGGIPVLQDREALAKDDRQVHRAEREKASVFHAAAYDESKYSLIHVFIGPRCPWSDLWIRLSLTH